MVDMVRILLIDDNADDRLLTERALRQEFAHLRVKQIVDAESFAQEVERGDFDLVITDYQLHWSSGLEVLRTVKARWPDRPVVMFTGTGNEEIAVEAMKAGLDDYIIKSPKHFARLSAAVRVALERAVERRARWEAENRYRDLFERVPIGLYRTAPDGRFLEVNLALAQMLGCPDRESLLAVSAVDLYVDPEDRKRWQVLLEREGVVRGFEVQLRRCDGTVIWALDTAQVVRDGEGRVLYYEGNLENITDRRRAEEALRRRAAQLAQLNEFAGKVIAVLEVESLLDWAVRLIQEGFGYHHVGIFILDPEGGELVMQAQAGAFAHLIPADHSVALGEGVIGWVGQHGKTLLVNDVEADPRYVEHFPDALPTRSELGVPVRMGEEVVGVLDVQSPRRDAFDESDVTVVETLAELVAVALENAQLFEEVCARFDELAVLNDLAQALTARLDVKGVVDAAYRGVSRLLDTTNFYVALYDPDEDTVTFVFNVTEGEVNEPYVTRRAGRGLTEYVIRHRTPVLIRENLPEWLEEAGVEPIGRIALSWMGVPLMVGGRVVGVMAVQSYTPPRAYDAHDLDLLTAVASQTAMALENARLFEETRRRLAREERLHELARTMGGEMELAVLIPRLLPAVAEMTDADAATVAILDSQRQVISYPYLYNLPRALADVEAPAGSGLAGQVMQTRRSVLLDDYRDHPAAVQSWVEAGVRSLLTIPLVAGDEVVGALGLFSLGEVRPFGREAVTAAEAASRLAAVAVQRARLFEAEREQRELAEALAEASAIVGSTLDLDQVLDLILGQVERVVAGDAFNIMMIEDGHARVARWRGYERLGVGDEIAGLSIPIGEYPSLRRMVGSGEPVLISDVRAEPSWVEREGWEWQRAYLGVPIRVAGLTVGFLNVDAAHPGRFGPDDARRLQVFARYVATAIENAQLYRELRNYAERLEERVRERTAQLQAQYARLEAILRSTADGVVVADAEGRILQTNPVAQAWLTHTLSPEDADRLREVVRELAARAE
ncbi:MAG TPA: GAF domain-containing protein, partial [Anaerolineae bacterium]|nr:GAF domain-containing protein [Anaerolineae bacterium]